MGTFTANLGLSQMAPNDPSVANVWGANLNSQVIGLLDSAIAGLLSLSVAGSSNVVLTNSNGAPDQERNAVFVFSGALTGNILVLFPAGKSKVFVAKNSSSGAFTLGIGVNNGSGGSAGATVTIAQGAVATLYSDGTNVYLVSGDLVPGTSYPALSGGYTCTLTLLGNTNVSLPPSGNVPSVTVSSSGPSGNPGVVGALWFQT